MSSRAARLAGFISDRKPEAQKVVEVLCEDSYGKYLLPFPCRWNELAWENADTGAALETEVVGWRERTT